MSRRKTLAEIIHGCFPKESSPSTQTKTQDKSFKHSYRWPVTGVVIATVEGALLGFLGYLAGLTCIFSFYGWLAITLLSVVITAAAWNAAWPAAGNESYSNLQFIWKIVRLRDYLAERLRRP